MTTAKKNAKKIIVKYVVIYMHMGKTNPQILTQISIMIVINIA